MSAQKCKVTVLMSDGALLTEYFDVVDEQEVADVFAELVHMFEEFAVNEAPGALCDRKRSKRWPH